MQTDTKVLLSRFSETRRKHPLSDSKTSLEEAIAKERELLGPIINSAELVIDTTRMSVYALREQIRERVAPRTPGSVSIMIESFGYKNGLPANADFVFDVRCLPNPYWEPQLRALSRQGRARQARSSMPRRWCSAWSTTSRRSSRNGFRATRTFSART